MSESSDKLNKKTSDVISDTDDGHLEVDWDTIEKRYREHFRRRHRHHHVHNDAENNLTDNADTRTGGNNNPLTSKGNTHISSDNQKNNTANQSPDSTTHKNIAANSGRRRKKKHKILKITMISIVCLLLAISILILTLFLIGKNSLLDYDTANITPPAFADYEDNGKTIYYKGHTYKFNEQISSILFIGVDNRQMKNNATAGTAGQGDALFLFTYNVSNGQIKLLSLNRDTMTDIIRYDSNGKYYDTSTSQLCLAYAYGDGKVLSAENQVVAVERLIYNIPINGYYAIDLDAIKTLNDDIGGVTLTPEYTFKSFVAGEQVTIKGDMAEQFVRYRDVSLLDDNLRRMECQKLYINSFASQTVSAIRDDLQVPIKLYQHSSENTVTNINTPILTYLAISLASNYKGLNITSVKGKYVDSPDDDFAEYKINKRNLFETVLDIFYEKTD